MSKKYTDKIIRTRNIFILIWISCFILSTKTIKAQQVIIGSTNTSETGALLALKTESDGTAKQGILYPRVALQSLTELEPCVVNATDIDKNKHIGLLVYNVAEVGLDIQKGTYLWIGKRWVPLSIIAEEGN